MTVRGTIGPQLRGPKACVATCIPARSRFGSRLSYWTASRSWLSAKACRHLNGRARRSGKTSKVSWPMGRGVVRSSSEDGGHRAHTPRVSLTQEFPRAGARAEAGGRSKVADLHKAATASNHNTRIHNWESDPHADRTTTATRACEHCGEAFEPAPLVHRRPAQRYCAPACRKRAERKRARDRASHD